MLLPETDQAGADSAAERLRDAVREVPMLAGAVQWTGGSAEGSSAGPAGSRPALSEAVVVVAPPANGGHVRRSGSPPDSGLECRVYVTHTRRSSRHLDVRRRRLATLPTQPQLTFAYAARSRIHSARSAGSSGARRGALQQRLVEQDRVADTSRTVTPCSGRETTSMRVARRPASPRPRSAGRRPGREACAKRLTIVGSPIRSASLAHGSRGWQTSSSTAPIRQRSPTTAPLTSRPSVVRFSPNAPGPELAPELALPERRVLGRVGVDGLVGAAVDAPVGLVVALDVDARDAHAALDRRLADRAHQRPPAPHARAAAGGRR